jgi:hypothetical protein
MTTRRKNRANRAFWQSSLENLESRVLLSAAPNLDVSIVKITAPDILVPGDQFSINVKITNLGDVTASGTLQSVVYASTDQALDASDIPLSNPNSNPIKVNLAPGKSITITGKLPIQSSVLPGTYYVLVNEESTLTVPDTDTANDTAVSDGTRDVVWQFGNVGTRKNVKMKVEYDQQTPVTFALTGAGTGQIDNPGDPIADLNVSVTGSAFSSNLNITTPAKEFTKIHGISITGSINRIAAATTSLGAGITVTGLARTINVYDLDWTGHVINLNTDALAVPVSAKVDLTAHAIRGCVVDAGGIPIGTLKAYKVTDLILTAPTVQAITLTDKIKSDVALWGELTISQGGATVPANAKVNITAGWINNCALVTNDLPIGSLSAYRATALNLTAPSMQSMNVTDRIPGDVALSGSITLTSSYGTNYLSLGKLAVSGDIEDLTLLLGEGGASSISCRSWDGGELVVSDTLGSLSVGGSMDADVGGIWFKKVTIGEDYSGTWGAGFGSMTIKGEMDNATMDIGPHMGGVDWNQFDSLTVKGWVYNSTIRTSNPVGSITVGGLDHSNIRIGADTVFPESQSDFESHHTGTIRSLTVTGMKVLGSNVESIKNSDIAAWSITTLKLAFIETNNSGTPFGVASTAIGTFTYRHLTGMTDTSKNLTTADSFTQGDFELRIL